ncbi:MAG: zinc-binding dehydrogenase [Proteobacteria bacterium]|nr:zinc-binding dehydrogenase [Pseudomonadota bacterium]
MTAASPAPTMRAAVLYESGADLVVERELPVAAPGPGQVQVRLAYSGVCHSQLMEVRGRRGVDPHLPHLLGHEGCGVVTAIGPDVTRVAPGQRVVLSWLKAGGHDVAGAGTSRGRETIHAGPVTTFSDYSVVSENRCTPCPDGVPPHLAVLLGCALLTGAGIVTRTLAPRPGESLAVFGLGGVGLSALLAARLAGCRPLVAVDVAADKLALAREFGATHTVDATQIDPVAAVRELTQGGADYSVEAAGRARVIEEAFESVRRGGGRCVFAGHPEASERLQLDPFELIAGRRIEGSWGGEAEPERDIPRYAALYARGELPLERLVTPAYELEDVNQALEDLEARRVPRAVLRLEAAGELA